MSDCPEKRNHLPNAPGVGYKPQHYSALFDDPGDVSWLEIHAENYMGEGGRPLAQLSRLSEKFAISAHGVGSSIGGEGALDLEHLARLKHLNDWLKPAAFSEHLAWSSHDGTYLNDLLPLPYTNATLSHVCDHVDQLQTAIGRQIMLENPSSYLAFSESTFSEAGFLREVTLRTDCELLLDINNVFVSATNLGYNASEYIAEFPIERVGEIHLGGHSEDKDEHGNILLIDSHSQPVVESVWDLLDYVLSISGPRPILIEWDNDVPVWQRLRAEASRATIALAQATP